MPASLERISDSTPMGANLTDSGATFRVWAPHARRVHACVNGTAADDTNLLTLDQAGHWRGFLPGVQDRDRYKFFVVGDGSSGPKRDPFARELATPLPGRLRRSCVRFSVARDRICHAAVSRFRDLSVARRRVFYAESAAQGGDVSRCRRKIPHLAGLGITAVQLMPIQEFSDPVQPRL